MDFNEFSSFGFTEENPSVGQNKAFYYTLKSAIAKKGYAQSTGAQILKEYYPDYDAEIVEVLDSLGGEFLGTTKMDEFGIGSFTENTFEPLMRPGRKCGGSSGGAAFVCKDLKDIPNLINISESTGGSSSTPAAFENVFSFTPTYGSISRYGVMVYAHTLDRLCFICSNYPFLYHMANILLKKEYTKDPTINMSPQVDLGQGQSFILGPDLFPTEFYNSFLERVQNLFPGVEFKEFPSSFLKRAGEIYCELSAIEVYSNTLRFDGNYYQLRNMDYDSRTRVINSKKMPDTLKKTFNGSMLVKKYPLLLERWKQLNTEVYDYLGDFKYLIGPGLPDYTRNIDNDSILDLLTMGPNMFNMPQLIIPDSVEENYIPIMIASAPNTDLSLLNEFK